MILPTKGVPPGRALISLGADILRLLTETKTVSRLWDDFRKSKVTTTDVTFDWFVLSLDLLFLVGAIEFDRGRVRRPPQPVHEGAAS
jgi:hypothetical protein